MEEYAISTESRQVEAMEEMEVAVASTSTVTYYGDTNRNNPTCYEAYVPKS